MRKQKTLESFQKKLTISKYRMTKYRKSLDGKTKNSNFPLFRKQRKNVCMFKEREIDEVNEQIARSPLISHLQRICGCS
jgi:DNA-binding transcriptional regulator/RsmH inhibitor MraZ